MYFQWQLHKGQQVQAKQYALLCMKLYFFCTLSIQPPAVVCPYYSHCAPTIYLQVLGAGGTEAYKVTASALTSLPGDEDGFI